MNKQTPQLGLPEKTAETLPTVSAEGVSGSEKPNTWFVAIVKRNSEKVCRDMLLQEGFEAYVATQSLMRHYDKRRPKLVELVSIPAKVFIRMAPLTTSKQRSLFFGSHPYISSFMLDRARELCDYGRINYAEIPDRQIQELRYMLHDAEKEVLFGYPDSSYQVGGWVKAVRGVMKGKEGRIASRNGKSFFCLEIPYLDWAKVQISLEDIVPIDHPTTP